MCPLSTPALPTTTNRPGDMCLAYTLCQSHQPSTRFASGKICYLAVAHQRCQHFLEVSGHCNSAHAFAIPHQQAQQGKASKDHAPHVSAWPLSLVINTPRHVRIPTSSTEKTKPPDNLAKAVRCKIQAQQGTDKSAAVKKWRHLLSMEWHGRTGNDCTQ